MSTPARSPTSDHATRIFQARSQGGFGGCGRTPLFLGPKKKKPMVFALNGLRLAAVRFPGAIAPACTAVGLSKHDPEANLESVAV